MWLWVLCVNVCGCMCCGRCVGCVLCCVVVCVIGVARVLCDMGRWFSWLQPRAMLVCVSLCVGVMHVVGCVWIELLCVACV